jgi:diamine N-acetyltransferase
MSANISLRELSHENLESVLILEVTEKQKAFYPRSNAESIAEGYYPADDDPVWMRVIYAGEIPVGFLMTSEAPPQGEYFLWRIMIDARYQSEGYAAQAVGHLIARIKGTPNGKSLVTSHVKGNEQAGRFFEKLGFSYTGEMLGDADCLMTMDFHDLG